MTLSKWRERPRCGTNKLSHQRPHCEQVVYTVENGKTNNKITETNRNPVRKNIS